MLQVYNGSAEPFNHESTISRSTPEGLSNIRCVEKFLHTNDIMTISKLSISKV